MNSEINSEEYWNQRFSSDWCEKSGPAQTEMFARIAIAMMPDWLKGDIVGNALGVVDFGCATGEAVHSLSVALGPRVKVSGVDFAETAINEATRKFSAYSFTKTDLTDWSMVTDVVFTSNTLEHFQDPLAVLSQIANHSTRHVVVLVPFMELNRDIEHEVTFNFDALPAVLAPGHVCSYLDVVNCADIPGTLWSGYQALVVYSMPDALLQMGISLDQLALGLQVKSMTETEIEGMSKVTSLLHREGKLVKELREARGMLAQRTEDALSALQSRVIATLEEAQRAGSSRLEPVLCEMSEAGKQLARYGHEMNTRLDEIEYGVKESLQVQSDELANLRLRQAESLARDEMIRALHSQLESARMEVAAAISSREKIGLELEQTRQLQHETEALSARWSSELYRLRFKHGEIEAKYNEILASRSWRLTALFRHVARRVRGLVNPTLRARTSVSSLASNVPAHYEAVPGVSPVQDERRSDEDALKEILRSHEGLPIVVFNPLVDWNLPLFQRPHHIASRLAKGGSLYFYCTPNAYDHISGFVKVSENLYLTNRFDLLDALDFPRTTHLYSTDNHFSVEQLRKCRERGDTLLYEYIDEIDPLISGVEIKDSVWEKHRNLIQDESVVCITSADKLHKEVCQFRTRNAHLVTNGVEYEHFNAISHMDVPVELRDWVGSGVPIVGYFGALARWFDYELVAKLAESRPHCNILLVGWDYDGSLSESRIESFPNVRVIGPIPYKELPQYARHFDVSTIPFLINNITESTSPIKLFEYMALGKPIVSTRLPECEKYRSVLIANNHDDFIRQVDTALSLRGAPTYQDTLREEALANTWDQKALEYLSRHEAGGEPFAADLNVVAMINHKLLVAGYFGYGNFGDELFLRAFHKNLTGYQVRAVTDAVTNTGIDHERIRGMVDECDAVIIGGGDLVVPYALSELYWHPDFLRRPIFIHSVGVPLWGGVNTEVIRALREFFRNPAVHFVSARDLQSGDWIRRNLQPEVDVSCYPDMVCSLDFRAKAEPNPMVFGLVLRYQSIGFHDENLRWLFREIHAAGYKLRVIVLGTGATARSDLAAICKVVFPEPCDIILRTEIDELDNELSGCTLVASQKFHGSVVCALVGVPCFGMSDSNKVTNFYAKLGRPLWTADLHSPKFQARFAGFLKSPAFHFPESLRLAAVRGMDALKSRLGEVL